jgi:hypothetical protein
MRWLLWLAALIALPLPLFGLESGRVPALYQLELGALSATFSLLERAQGVGPMVALLFLGQGLAWALVLWLGAALLARLFSRLPPRLRSRAALYLVVLGFAFAILKPIYLNPYSSHALQTNLLDLYR